MAMKMSLRAESLPVVRRNGLDFGALLLTLAALLVIAAVSLWQLWHVNRIYTGVTVAGVHVGGLSRAVAHARLQQANLAASLPPVNLVHDERQWTLDPLQIQAKPALLDAVDHAYLVGRTGSPGEQAIAQIAALLGGVTITPRLSYQTEFLADAVHQAATQFNRPAQSAIQLGVISAPAQLGVAVDEAATLKRLIAAMDAAPAGQPLRVPVVAVETQAEAESGVLQPVAAQQVFDAPLLLMNDAMGLQLALDPALLNAILISTAPAQADADQLRTWLAELARQIDRPARDARLRFNPATGGVIVTQESVTGRQLDIDATLAAIQQALLVGDDQAQLVVDAVAPKVDGSRVAEMGIRELVTDGVTYFGGSSAERIRNIEVAAAKFDGVVIPPGEVFSFNKIVQDVSGANGFEDSLIIWGDRTAVGVGGGVCQVSTTIFRAAYEGGFPIVERYNHGYVVDWYGKPGLDATIFTPSVDFRFRNDTDAYLLIQPAVDSANGVITFNFYGSRPNRQVSISEPVITDVKKPEAPLYTADASLATGQQKQVEYAKDGMTATVDRTIVENGTTRTDRLVSVYQPWRAIFLVSPDSELLAPSAATLGEQTTP
jgi:vancomycin resistance protein YoaR